MGSVVLKGEFIEVTAPEGDSWIVPYWNDNQAEIARALEHQGVRLSDSDIIPAGDREDSYALYFKVDDKKTVDFALDYLEESGLIRPERDSVFDWANSNYGVTGVFRVRACIDAAHLKDVAAVRAVAALRPIAESSNLMLETVGRVDALKPLTL